VTSHTSQKPQPNLLFGFAALNAAASHWLWTMPGGDFGVKSLAGFTAFSAVACAITGLQQARKLRRRRQQKRRALQKSTTLGAARYANHLELNREGFFDPSGSMLLGLSEDGSPTFLPKGRHLACQASTGEGKTSAAVANAIAHSLFTGRSCVVADAKNELAAMWAEPLRELGFNVLINNSGDVPGWEHDDSNPFAVIVEACADPKFRGEVFTNAEAFARALIPEEKGEGKNRFFTQLDREAFIFVLVALAVLRPELCYPAQVYRHLVDPRLFKDLCFEARDSDYD